MKVFIGIFDDAPVAASLDRDSAISALKQQVLEWYNDRLVRAVIACNRGASREHQIKIKLLRCNAYEEITGDKVSKLHDYANGTPPLWCDDFCSYETPDEFYGCFCMKHRISDSQEPNIGWRLYELELW